ncbi:ligase-associated DNA damage response DEXH box helicase [Rubrimonas cliftonensis]|uniref:ATP-dependent helicase Lhr and Lhr-like helicase n=1 Tax=Rubrimonas cliftonensis TaxID=89524 RepID=A0A1H3VNI3_9RHOB|nr:ligase-associated DNA damage response DEXH box helicase [Rubrimonas cliftonensis]SDZ76367.1 ATP-dependent helicase Lhr and Lhr-like helicase [Rubrimonas cliftonensis]
MDAAAPSPDAPALPRRLRDWFEGRGWAPHPHQLALLARARLGGADLLIAPTGAGKTLAGFLPSLAALIENPAPGLHTLYVSPLKALAADIRRNLEGPARDMALPIRIEDRTGDTRASVKARQRRDPPHILLTTPESLALLVASEHAGETFRGLKAVVVDEAHALAESKRGDQLALCLARLDTLAPGHRRVGLSATTEDPEGLARWLAPDGCRLLRAPDGPDPDIAILDDAGDPPWSGMGGRYAVRAIYERVKAARTTLIFINTRALAELFFRALWEVNADNLPIGLHHGSLGREARQRVEAAMAAGELRAVVCTSSLDLGVDWGDVDLVIQVGAPKGVKRLVQRIGRANHRFDAPSRALVVPANRLEVLECRAALEAVREGRLDGEPRALGRLDVLCQHILLVACAGPFEADALFAEVRRAGPYAALDREDFDRCLDFCATGGYALRAYDEWRRLMQAPDGLWRLRDPRAARRLRMNVGVIVEAETLKVQAGSRRGGGRLLGEVEEAFAATLSPGDTFLIGGEVVRFEGLREMSLQVTKAPGRDPKIPVFAGGKLPISTLLAERVMAMLNAPEQWSALPAPVADWLRLHAARSGMPRADDLLVETFPRAGRWFMAAWGFAGRNAHQTLGLLATRRMEALGLAPLGFLANDYAVLVWSLDPVDDPAPIFAREGLAEGLEQWLAETSVMKRAFRQVAVVSGLVQRRLPGEVKSGRQATFSSDILYDTLRKYDPGHLMLAITRAEAQRGLVDFERVEAMLDRIGGRIRHIRSPRMTPLCAPLMMEMGREKVPGAAEDRLLEEEVEALVAEAEGRA